MPPPAALHSYAATDSRNRHTYRVHVRLPHAFCYRAAASHYWPAVVADGLALPAIAPTYRDLC